MNVSLPIPLEEFARQKVADGEYRSVDEVVCEGLRLLQQQEAWKAQAGHDIEIGWNQAKIGELLTPEQAQSDLAARKEAWKQNHGR